MNKSELIVKLEPLFKENTDLFKKIAPVLYLKQETYLVKNYLGNKSVNTIFKTIVKK